MRRARPRSDAAACKRGTHLPPPRDAAHNGDVCLGVVHRSALTRRWKKEEKEHMSAWGHLWGHLWGGGGLIAIQCRFAVEEAHLQRTPELNEAIKEARVGNGNWRGAAKPEGDGVGCV